MNEAMAAGKAIVVSDKVVCALDLLKENLSGKAFNCTKLDELLKALKDLTASKENLKRMGEVSRNINSGYTFRHQVESIVDQLLKKKQRIDL